MNEVVEVLEVINTGVWSIAAMQLFVIILVLFGSKK